MLRIYGLIIVLGLLAGAGYGAYYYYNDTQQRIKTLQENNAKLETVAKTNELTINSLQQSQEKFAELNNELQIKLDEAESYGDNLRKKLHNAIYKSCNTYFAKTFTKIISDSGKTKENLNNWKKHIEHVQFGGGNTNTIG